MIVSFTGGDVANAQWMPRIDVQQCTGCGDCISRCPTGALGWVAGKAALVRPELCIYCADCERLCPEGAIQLPYRVVLGKGGPVMNALPYMHIPDLAGAVPEIPADSIISRTVYADERVKVVMFSFAQGQELSEHTASQPAILHFLAGEAGLVLGGDALDVHAGAWIHMTPHLPHTVTARTPVTMLLYLFREG